MVLSDLSCDGLSRELLVGCRPLLALTVLVAAIGIEVDSSSSSDSDSESALDSLLALLSLDSLSMSVERVLIFVLSEVIGVLLVIVSDWGSDV